jgi:pseudomonalisin
MLYLARTLGTLVIAAIVVGVAVGAARADDFAALVGNHPEGAAGLAAEGMAATYRPLQMEIYLRPRNQAERDRLAAELQDPTSPHYHHFLTPDEYNRRFGPTQADVDQVSNWLTSQGFTVTQASAHDGRIMFSSDVVTAENAFLVHIAASRDDRHFTNLEDPQVPAEVAPKIGYLAGLDNLGGVVWNTDINDPPLFIQQGVLPPPYFGPTDIRTFIDANPLLTAAPTKWDGTGQCIAVSEGMNVDLASLNHFSKYFGLPTLTSGTNYDTDFPDGNPGTPVGQTGVAPYAEAMVDIEYAHGLAPGAEIVLYAANAATNNPNGPSNLVDTVKDIVNNVKHSCNTVAVSWAQCGAPSFFTMLDGYFQQGAMEGKSIFVATGDVGAAGLVSGPNGCIPAHSPHIEETAGSPNVTAVGASEMEATYGNNGDDTSTDTGTKQSVWSFSLTSVHVSTSAGASTGGVSKIFAIPSWQKKIPGITGRHRVVPDLVLGGGNLGGKEVITPRKNGPPKITGRIFAAPYFWLCADINFMSGIANPGGPFWTETGGTSPVPPQYAAIFAIVNQKTAATQGLINRKLYAMAKANIRNLSNVGIIDITSGNNSYAPVKGFAAKKGFDYASGWGAVDMANFVDAFISFAFIGADQ